jgi:hypothetical protein
LRIIGRQFLSLDGDGAFGDAELPQERRRGGHETADVLDGPFELLGVGHGRLGMSRHRDVLEVLGGKGDAALRRGLPEGHSPLPLEAG